MKQKNPATYMEPSLLLLDFFESAVCKKEKEGKFRTAANYRSTKRKAEAFINASTGNRPLQESVSEWAQRWVAHLTALHPNHPETVDFYLRNARAMYHIALADLKNRQGYTPHPFKDIRIRKIQPSKRALPEQEIKKLLAPQLRERLKPSARETLDVLLFTLFAQGMVFQDVYNLRWDMVDCDGRIRYWRSKTGNLVEVGVVPEAREIMERYRFEGAVFVFPFLHEGKLKGRDTVSEQTALRRVNHNASAIGKEAGLSLPLTTYVLRHTWATLMLESGKTVELISQCLGHSNIRTTQIYLSRISPAKVDSEVDDMFNRMLRPNFSDTPKDESPGPDIGRTANSSIKEKKSRKGKEITTHIPPIYKVQSKREKNKNSLFLNKKERLRLSFYYLMQFNATKIHISTIRTKFTIDYFNEKTTYPPLNHLKTALDTSRINHSTFCIIVF